MGQKNDMNYLKHQIYMNPILQLFSRNPMAAALSAFTSWAALATAAAAVIVAAFVTNLLLSAPAHAQSLLIDRMISGLAATKTISADFTQTTAGSSPSAGTKPRVSSGTFWISKPGLLRWEVKKPYPQLQILDGKEFWHYDPDLMQATVRSIESAEITGVAGLILNSSVLDRETLLARYSFKELSPRDGLFWVQVTPKVEEPGVSKLLVGLDQDAMMTRFEIHDRLGQITQVQLTGITKNTVLKPDLFKFKLDKGANVLRGR
jgi:outer membrane lipoprotein carrier protein